MNAKLTAMIVALGAYVVALSDGGFEIPAEMDAEIDELIAAADEFVPDMTGAETYAVLLAQLTDMLDAIKAELSAHEDANYRKYFCDVCDEYVTVEIGTYAEDNDMCPTCWRAYQGG